MPDNIQILLATYNGEKFLEQQLESLLNQSVDTWRLVIRDDGSTDGTVSIITRYRDQHPGKITILNNDDRNLGAVGNFSFLLEMATADYIMFCDQDDIWLPNKISTTLTKMHDLEKEHGNGIPLLVYTDMKVVDEKLGPLSDSVWRYQQLDPRNGSRLNRLLLHNIATGCTMMINRKMRDVAIPIPLEAVMHDWWLSLVAAAFGRSGFVSEPTVLYRQHGKNAIGAESWDLMNEIRKIITPSLRAKVVAQRDVLLGKYQKQAEAFFSRYGTRLSPENYSMVTTYANLYNCNVLMQKYYILKYRFFYSNPLVTAGMILFRW